MSSQHLHCHFHHEQIRKKEKEKFLIEKKDYDEKLKIQNDIELNKWRKIINIYKLKSSSDIQNENQHFKNGNFPLNGSFDGFHISPFPESVTGNEKDKTDYYKKKNQCNDNRKVIKTPMITIIMTMPAE